MNACHTLMVSTLLEELSMVVRALRSDARRLRLVQRPCTSRRWVTGRSQGTTLSVSDSHNAPTIIPNLFHNIDYQIIKQIRQNNTRIEADILFINLTPNPYNALAPASVYVSNDVTILSNFT